MKYKTKRCPNCGIIMDVEDTRADTDRGVYGSIIYYCVDCDYQEDEEE